MLILPQYKSMLWHIMLFFQGNPYLKKNIPNHKKKYKVTKSLKKAWNQRYSLMILDKTCSGGHPTIRTSSSNTIVGTLFTP